MFVAVHTNCCSTVTSSADPEDQWDRDDTDTSWDFESLELVGRDGYDTIATNFEVAVGDELHLLWVIYSTGNSFGNDDGGQHELVGLYQNPHVAAQNKERISRHAEWYRNNHRYSTKKKVDVKPEFAKDDYTVVLLSEDGKDVELHVPWNGYFESVDDVRVESSIVR
jgi:hypothetical protein